MGYKKISGRDTKELTLELETIQYGGQMRTGTHVVTIEEVVLEDDRAKLTFKNHFGETHRANIFIHNVTKDSTSFLYRRLVASTADDVADLWELNDNPKELPRLKGKAVLLTLKQGEGLALQNTTKGFRAGRYSASTVGELREILKEAGEKLAYPKIEDIQSTDIKTTKKKKQGLPNRLKF